MNPEAIKECLGKLKLVKIVAKIEKKKISFICESDSLVSARQIISIRKKIAALEEYDYNSIEVIVKYSEQVDFENAITEYVKQITMLLAAETPMAAAFCDIVKAEFSTGHLKIWVKGNSSFICNDSFKTFFELKIREMFDKKVQVSFVDASENNFDEYMARTAIEEARLVENLNESAKQVEKFVEQQAKEKKIEIDLDNPVLYGKGQIDELIHMDEINMDTGRVSCAGYVLSVEDKVTKSGLHILSFIVTDYTFSHTCKLFAKEAQYEVLKYRLKEGIYVKLRGVLEYDQFVKESVFKASDVVVGIPTFKTDDALNKRVELHLHSNMSSMDAVTDIKDYINRAYQWGHKAIAITDHGVVQAFPHAFKAVNRINKGKEDNEKIKLIYGVEGYLENPNYVKDDTLPPLRRNYHIIVLVKSQEGIKNLYKLVSYAHLENFVRVPRYTKEVLEKHREGLLIGSACEAGELFDAVVRGESDERLCEIASFYDYLEVQPLGNNEYMIRSDKFPEVNSFKDLEAFNLKIYELAKKLGKPCVATGDVHFIDPQEEYYRRILMHYKGFEDADSQPPLYFRTTNEMLDEFKYMSDEDAKKVVIDYPNQIADMIDEVRPIPEGTFPPVIENAEEEIRSMSWNKAIELYGDPLPKNIKAQIDKELNSICGHGFSVMYLIAQKLVRKSNDDGYLVGSRGSVGSSFVAYLTGITEVNSVQPHYRCLNEDCKYSEFVTDGSYECGFDMPQKDCPKCGRPLMRDGYDIPFETFLGFDGDKEPDIDLNFSGVYQPMAHKYTEVLFGEGHVFRAGTIGAVAEKTAYGYVKKYLEEKELPYNRAEMLRLARGCEGVKRTSGQHPGGIMIIPKDKEVYDFTPIQHPADSVDSDVITTHFDYNFLHGSILKLDILAHVDPTAIRMLENLTGIDAKTIEIGEAKTMTLFHSTDALGVEPSDIGSEVGTVAIPEFGTAFVRQMLVDTKPTLFSELIRISGLSHGTDVWLGNAQELIVNGVCTLKDAICCRDDIMLYLRYHGVPDKIAFFIMEDVRKGKGLKPEQEDIMRANDIPDWYIDSCKKIKYMFPKAHAAAYVMMAFRIAWFKVYYPVEFYATYYTTRSGGDFDASIMVHGIDIARKELKEYKKIDNPTAKEKGVITILEVVIEMYCRGIKFAPMSVYDSDATEFTIVDGEIVPPLTAIQGLGESAAKKIKEAINDGGGKFMSQDEFKRRTGAGDSIMHALMDCGAIDKNLPETSQVTLFGL